MLTIWSSIKFCCFVNPFSNNPWFLSDYSNLDLQVFWKQCGKRINCLKRLFSTFSSFIFCSIIDLFEKQKGAYSCLPPEDSLNYSWSFFQRMVSLMVILFSTKCSLFVYIYIDLLKLKASKLFENSDADLSWLLFLKKPTCLSYVWHVY